MVWTLENPGTADRLWDLDWTQSNLLHLRNVDYCAYGFLTKKNTTIAFSDAQSWSTFTPRLCRGDECPSRTVDPMSSSGDSGGSVRKNHCPWDFFNGAKVRSSIPEQLCYNVLVVLKLRAVQIANELVNQAK